MDTDFWWSDLDSAGPHDSTSYEMSNGERAQGAPNLRFALTWTGQNQPVFRGFMRRR